MVAGKVLDKRAAKAVAQAAMLLTAHEMSREHNADTAYLGLVCRYIKLWGEAEGTAEDRFRQADEQLFDFKPHSKRHEAMIAIQHEIRDEAVAEARSYIEEGLKNPYQKS